jgi:hypothetical protein
MADASATPIAAHIVHASRASLRAFPWCRVMSGALAAIDCPIVAGRCKLPAPIDAEREP